jgi:hypothetical protein
MLVAFKDITSRKSFSLALEDRRDCRHSLDLTPTADCLSLARNLQLHFGCRAVTDRRVHADRPLPDRPPLEIPVCANTAAPALTEKLAAFVGSDAACVQLSSLCPLFWLNESRSRDSPEKPFDFAAGGLPLRFPRLHSWSAAERTAAIPTRPSRSDPFREVALLARSGRPCVLPNISLDRALAPERSGALTSTARAKIADGVAMHRDLKPLNLLPDGAQLPVIAGRGAVLEPGWRNAFAR